MDTDSNEWKYDDVSRMYCSKNKFNGIIPSINSSEAGTNDVRLYGTMYDDTTSRTADEYSKM